MNAEKIASLVSRIAQIETQLVELKNEVAAEKESMTGAAVKVLLPFNQNSLVHANKGAIQTKRVKAIGDASDSLANALNALKTAERFIGDSGEVSADQH